jgi:hypothetical protein
VCVGVALFMVLTFEYWVLCVVGAATLLCVLLVYMLTDSGPRGRIDLTNPYTHVIITGTSINKLCHDLMIDYCRRI